MVESDLPFTSPWLLAPMEGVTDPLYRGLVLALHEPANLGGAFTEFLRISTRPAKGRDILRHMGPCTSPIPVGLQLMGSNVEFMAESAREAVRVGAPVIDINFGCPAKGALQGCAGSSMLRDPAGVENMVRAIARAV
ncbi:MAG: tRNA-dihydrouridine synthase, partial [Planctomycetes bacterium]|nr:tRNA-dihydrouridine synthase [Planctomycetota bacterium]